MLLTYRGPQALSAFRRDPLLARCRSLLGRIQDLTTSYAFLVHLSSSISTADRDKLENILGTGEPAAVAGGGGEVLLAPRPGTASPWSTKATDIMRNCGLAVDRIERGITYRFTGDSALSPTDLQPVVHLLYDRMTEAVIDEVDALFAHVEPQPLQRIPLLERGRAALEGANGAMGLAMAADEIEYFHDAFLGMRRDPTDVELMMFSVVNSEHCRHKIFNADWTVDQKRQPHSLFAMIRNTHQRQPQGTVKAYADNSGIIEGFATRVFRPLSNRSYGTADETVHILIKVETHNHPTAISPYPGASTGVGGEIRDEGAAGRGGHSQAGLSAFFTSHLRIDGWRQPWERDFGEFPARLATPLEIMTEGPIGGAGFGNEFGRPNILGIFRTFEEECAGRYRGYHKPIMVAGGVGLIDAGQVEKQPARSGDYVVQIGGPAMLIGLGGGAASSMDTGSNQEDLDFASVQRDTPEMQRRCQELISRCTQLGAGNPIVSIHDVGAGGLSNACPELVEEVGARFDLRAIHNDDPGMSPMQIWSNEAQERYVLVVSRDRLPVFEQLAARERCLFAVIGEVTGDGVLNLDDPLLDEAPIDDLNLEVLLGKPPRMHRVVKRQRDQHMPLALDEVTVAEATERVLRFPAVAGKTFLITIADRTVTGLIARDQMVGPFQVPIANVGVTSHSFHAHNGSAMAMGERTPLALIDAPASGRMAVAEAITNIAAAGIGPIANIKLSGNWMCACGEPGEDARLYDTVSAIGLEFCPTLGVSIPVGKDSLSMRTVWEDAKGVARKNVAPLSLVISAFAPVPDVRRVLTPDLKPETGSHLLLIDLGHSRNRLGSSILAQAYSQIGDTGPDEAAHDLRRLYEAVQQLLRDDLVLAYHDRSDGGLLATLCEMAFGGRRGLRVDVGSLGPDPLASLFAEEIGVVLQVGTAALQAARRVLEAHSLAGSTHDLGTVADAGNLRIEIAHDADVVLDRPVLELQQVWSELTHQMQRRRDNPACADEEFGALADTADPGLSFALTFPMPEVAAPAVATTRPRVAILREQGINGQIEMGAAFDAAGFEAVDVTMTDLAGGDTDLGGYQGLAACGGFSFGDVLGAGVGWARSILFQPSLREMFIAFFARPDTFSLGVCNGCQMLSQLAELIPGADSWPRFVRNRSEQFEARYVTVEVVESASVLLAGMAGARLGIACAHGEGRARFADAQSYQQLIDGNQVCLRYIDNRGRATERYPANPNGSPDGVTALTTADGRATIMMPHPERVFRKIQLSYAPAGWQGDYAPWLRLFQNARDFVAST